MNELIYPEISVKIQIDSSIKITIQINNFIEEKSFTKNDIFCFQIPKNWVLYSQSVLTEWDDEPISYEELIEEAEQHITDVDVYISRQTEKEIIHQIKKQIQETNNYNEQSIALKPTLK